jgi:hypothetical protein
MYVDSLHGNCMDIDNPGSDLCVRICVDAPLPMHLIRTSAPVVIP